MVVQQGLHAFDGFRFIVDDDGGEGGGLHFIYDLRFTIYE
jgi:hypothetical protein